MNALAVIFRLLSLFSVAGLAAFIWISSETEKAQKNNLLDDQVKNGYTILQSEKESQWENVSKKRSAFNEVFEDNQPVGLNDENPLADALADLRVAEDSILRSPEYRDTIDELTKEFGANSFYGIARLRNGKRILQLKSSPLLILRIHSQMKNFSLKKMLRKKMAL